MSTQPNDKDKATQNAQKSRRPMVLAGVTVVAVVLIAGIVVMLRSGHQHQQGSDGQLPATSSAAPSTSQEKEDLPGAYLRNTQRHWPRSWFDLDDSAWGEPGQYATDRLGRPLWIPVNHDGDYPPVEKKQDRPGQCDSIELAGTTQQQYANGRFFAVNEFAGPFEANKFSIPTNYSHSPEGAIMAAINAISFGATNKDEVGILAAGQLWDSEEKDRIAALADTDEADNFSDITSNEAAPSYSVLTCTKDVVTVELTAPRVYKGAPTGIWQLPMIWRNGTWVAVIGPADEDRLYRGDVTDTTGFTEVKYQ